MKTLYTSIGRFERRTEDYTKEYPVVIISGQEYMLDQQELILWSAMSWRFLKKKDIPRYYLRSLQNCDYKPQRSWEACLSRLITRGLVVSASGETDYDALYELISSLQIIPARGQFLVQLIAYCKLIKRYGFSFRMLKFIFRKDKRTEKEKQVMALIQQTQLSTAEVIKCIDRNIRSIPNEEAVMDILYHDDDTTSDNIACLVKGNESSKDVILAVSNLYLRQQIIFERIS